MRKLFSILSVLFVALFAVGCELTNPEENGVTFKFQNIKTTTNSVEVEVVPSDETKLYLACIIEAPEIADLTDGQIISKFTDAKDLSVTKGSKTLTAINLTPDTEYVAIAFTLTGSKVARQKLSTLPVQDPISGDDFEIEINVTDIKATSAVATATPNSSANRYYFRVITKMELDAFGIYDNDYQIFEYIIENPSSGEYITQGETTLNCRLNAKMDYLAVAFNFENWEAVHNQEEEIKLFRYEFSTPEAPEVDPDTLFAYDNLQVTHTGFSVDVTPAQGEESFWGYYVWTKKSYDETLATESKANIVMRSYFGLNNIGVEQGYDFGTFIQEYLGQTGSSTVINYLPLDNNTEYVLVLFYMDPEVSDPTTVYDYNYVAVPFKTLAPSADSAAMLEVSDPVIVKNGFKYDIQFLVKTDDKAVDMKVGAQLWNNYDFAKYWDPNDWSQIQAFFMFRTSVESSTLEAAKTAEGATVSFPGVDKEDYVFFFEVLNEENTATQYAIRVEPSLFDNAQ
ncbi:MAG: hypothetical protein J6U91_00370 [Alistipes sp.]|nr:hypothetical protein [Alistipes sp.]